MGSLIAICPCTRTWTATNQIHHDNGKHHALDSITGCKSLPLSNLSTHILTHIPSLLLDVWSCIMLNQSNNLNPAPWILWRVITNLSHSKTNKQGKLTAKRRRPSHLHRIGHLLHAQGGRAWPGHGHHGVRPGPAGKGSLRITGVCGNGFKQYPQNLQSSSQCDFASNKIRQIRAK